MGRLTRFQEEDIMSKIAFLKPKNSVKKIELPELESPVYIRKWSARERIGFTKDIASADSKGNVEIDTQKIFDQQIKFLQLVVCDEAGARIFDDSEADYKELAEVDANVIETLWTEAWIFNGMGKPALDEAVKNSEPSQT
jgi:hypothetical protein